MSEEITPDTSTLADAPAEGETHDVSTVEGEQTMEVDGTDALGDAGKKALDSMKSKWHTERDKRRELEARLAELSAPKTESTDQPDAEAIRAEAAREATAKANARILKSEVKAAAAGKLSDPRDALKFLDLDKFDVDESGNVDSDEIADAIEELIRTKPYLATKATRFQGTGDGGAARKAPGPSQLSRDDLRGMTPEQIVKAKAEGRLNDALGIK